MTWGSQGGFVFGFGVAKALFSRGLELPKLGVFCLIVFGGPLVGGKNVGKSFGSWDVMARLLKWNRFSEDHMEKIAVTCRLSSYTGLLKQNRILEDSVL